MNRHSRLIRCPACPTPPVFVSPGPRYGGYRARRLSPAYACSPRQPTEPPHSWPCRPPVGQTGRCGEFLCPSVECALDVHETGMCMRSSWGSSPCAWMKAPTHPWGHPSPLVDSAYRAYSPALAESKVLNMAERRSMLAVLALAALSTCVSSLDLPAVSDPRSEALRMMIAPNPSLDASISPSCAPVLHPRSSLPGTSVPKHRTLSAPPAADTPSHAANALQRASRESFALQTNSSAPVQAVPPERAGPHDTGRPPPPQAPPPLPRRGDSCRGRQLRGRPWRSA